MPPALNRSQFILSLREALVNLYNPYELKRSPLQACFVDQGPEMGSDLKQILVNGINALMPDTHTPLDTKAWKYYELLNYCYVDQLGQKEAARTLLISLRTLQRLLPEAVEVLAEKLASDYRLTLADTDQAPSHPEEVTQDASGMDESWVKETAVWKSNYSDHYIDIRKMLREIAQILQPIQGAGESKVQIEFPKETWLVMGQVTLLRQAVMTAISFFDQKEPSQKIDISSDRKGGQGRICIRGQSRDVDPHQRSLINKVDIPAALFNLMGLLKGGAEIQRDQPDGTSILLTFPAQRQFKILVIDDNADAIRLVEKYLGSGIYTVAGVQDPEMVIPTLEKEQPALILMDVMLPNIDGWMLLSQIRRNPANAKIPVIISTILPQEDLSISLGADGFLRKPYNQQELLRVLDDHLLKNPV